MAVPRDPKSRAPPGASSASGAIIRVPKDRSFDSDVVRFHCSARRCGAGLLSRVRQLSTSPSYPIRMLFDAGASRRPETFVMASAHVIEVGDITAGIVVFEQDGVRFFASERPFHPLDGALFRTVDQATRAARERPPPRPPAGPSGRKKKPRRSSPSHPNGPGDLAQTASSPFSPF